MFKDLTDESIQPGKIDIENIPDISLSNDLMCSIKNIFINEENGYSDIKAKTSIVQTDKNYVFFSNQWFYLAVVCKSYAEALFAYGDFFEKNIRKNSELLKKIVAKNYEAEELITLLPDSSDREYLKRYITADSSFRPGKQLINDDKAPRATKDIFSSCILKKLPVPDASSGYLGILIYYLAKESDVYDKLEKEVLNQIKTLSVSNKIKLSSTTRDCAQEIVDYIYDIDKFERLYDIMNVNGAYIKIDLFKTGLEFPSDRLLRYLFALPESKPYDPDSENKENRVFPREYNFALSDKMISCKLSTQWQNVEISENGSGNVLKALIKVINHYYADFLKITEYDSGYYLERNIQFKYEKLPDVFKKPFSNRFIVSLLAKPFVILTGNSGTGKTRISEQFAKYLEVELKNGEKNWLIVPVGADWTDNIKVLGFYNPLADNGKGKYEKTKILELIENANDNDKVPFFLILDEMNLSHVERYFSDFLSHMERTGSLLEIDGYPGKLKYPDNLFVVGTVNIDETTYMFSPKVLDRANVIEFKPDKSEVLNLFSADVVKNEIIPEKNGTSEAFLKLSREIRNGKFDVHTEDATDAVELLMQKFEALYVIMEQQGFEFAFRTVKEIKQYISASYEICDDKNSFNLGSAIDEQIVQKIMPKIHGNKKEIGKLLDELEQFCDNNQMPLSKSKVKQMKGKLETVQYASFI